jgi:hypothetical protein
MLEADKLRSKNKLALEPYIIVRFGENVHYFGRTPCKIIKIDALALKG